jgi:hypothetical protein
MRISPGSLPNQLNAPGTKCNISPITTNNIPTIINQRAIDSITHYNFSKGLANLIKKFAEIVIMDIVLLADLPDTCELFYFINFSRTLIQVIKWSL